MRERCWPGYKPTPGKKAYAKGSCVKEANAAAIAAATAISKKKSGNYDKEGMRKTPYKNPNHPKAKSNEERRKELREEDVGGTAEQVAGSAQSTLTDKPNREPMKTYKQKNITELSTDLLDRYKEKAAADSAKADKEGNTAKADKRFSGVVKAATKQFDNFKKKGFSEEDTTKKPEGFKSLKPKESEHETYYKFIAGKAKLGKPLSTKERSFAQSYKMAREETEQIAEISAMAHAKYKDAARKDIKANLKHIYGEYGDIAKNIVNRRMKGLAMSNATTKLKKEEVEQIDELSKSTLGSYVKKASTNARINSMISKDFDHKATTARKPSTRDAYYGLSSKHKQKSWKRSDNVAKAVDRLAKEEVEQIDEKNVPTSPEKWAQAKAQAKAKFDVYPSAYANGWAAKKYKAMGGGWKSVSEAVKDKFDIGEYDQEGDMAKSDLRSIMANAKKLHDMIEDADNLPEWCQNKITLAEDYISTVANYLTAEMNEEVEQIDELVGKGKLPAIAAYHKQKSAEAKDKMEKVRNTNTKLPVPKATSTKIYAKDAEAKYHSIQAKRANTLMKKEAKEDLPFTPDKPKKQSVVAGKYGKEYSTARHLARTAMQKQAEKMKKAPIKEESRKAAIVKDIMKKKKGSEDAFQKEPELSSTLTKVQ